MNPLQGSKGPSQAGGRSQAGQTQGQSHAGGSPEGGPRPRLWLLDLDGAGVAPALQPLGVEGLGAEALGSKGLGAAAFAALDRAEDGGLVPWERLAGVGGGASALALLALADLRWPGRPALALAVGSAVRAGLPTAARAHLAGRSPLNRGLTEGLIGGELGPRLAAVADGILILGDPERRGGLLGLGPAEEQSGGGRPAAKLEFGAAPWRELDPRGAVRRLREHWGPGAVLTCGPAGERGLPFANLANEADPPSFVGRGGLGALFAELGLKALHVSGVPAPAAKDVAWSERLARSPRLIQRSAGGSLELFEARAARGVTVGGASPTQDAESPGVSDRRHGCRGCPTPCGWVFERGATPATGSHFAALAPLGDLLGLPSKSAQQRVLAECDRLGLDAKESARVLRLAGHAGDADACVAALARWVREPDCPEAAGADALAGQLGVKAPDLLLGAEPIQRLAARTCGGASDPMRSFPFLVDGSAPQLARGLLQNWKLPIAALDPAQPLGKGHLLWWHESVVAAVDAVGFCAFSAGALLADGLAQLDELASWWFGGCGGPSDGEELLELGHAIVRARWALDRRLRGRGDAGASIDMAPRIEPNADRDARLEDAWQSYLELRFGTERATEVDGPIEASSNLEVEVAEQRFDRRPGTLVVAANGPLGVALGGRLFLDLPLPMAWEDTLARIVAERPSAAATLDGPGGNAAAGHVIRRAGTSSGAASDTASDSPSDPARDTVARRLAPNELLFDGDELWLVVALPGG